MIWSYKLIYSLGLLINTTYVALLISDATINNIVTNIPTIIVALTAAVASLASLRQGRQNGEKVDKANRIAAGANDKADVIGRKADEIGVKADAANKLATETKDKADSLVKKTDEIHILTNSNLAKVSTELQVATAKIAGLEGLIAQMVEAKIAAAGKVIPGPQGEQGIQGEQGLQGLQGPKGKITVE
jgi:hypothetical protein